MAGNPKDPQHPSGPVAVGAQQVHIDRDLCIGAATCLAIAPEVFDLDNEAKAIILQTADTVNPAALADAVKACPTAAISVAPLSPQQVPGSQV